MGFDRCTLSKVTEQEYKRDRCQVAGDRIIQHWPRLAIGVTGHLPPVTRTLVAAILLLLAATGVSAQTNILSHASDFTSVEYYPPPNQQQVKSRLSGAEAQPLPGGLLAIKQLKLEVFRPNGDPEIVVNAPECIYNQFEGTASSPGRLEVQTGDSRIRVEGEGFSWRQNDSFLTISNQVRTIIKTGPARGNKS